MSNPRFKLNELIWFNYWFKLMIKGGCVNFADYCIGSVLFDGFEFWLCPRFSSVRSILGLN